MLRKIINNSGREIELLIYEKEHIDYNADYDCFEKLIFNKDFIINQLKLFI